MMIHDLAEEAVTRRAAAQTYEELVVAGLVLNESTPRSVLEIGTASGGALWYWSKIASSHAKIASIDVSHHDLHDDFCVGPRQELLMHLGDSRDPASLSAVVEFFGDRIDFLFIDGDHSHEVALSDWVTYMPVVRPGGWVGFHDIEGPYVADGGSWRLWTEIKAAYPHDHVEIQLRREGGMGIGMVRV